MNIKGGIGSTGTVEVLGQGWVRDTLSLPKAMTLTRTAE